MLAAQLELLHSQLLAVLTTAAERALLRSPRFDLRTLLGGTAGIFAVLAHALDWNPAVLLGSAQPLPLASGARQAALAALRSACGGAGPALFGVLLADHHPVAVLAPRGGAAGGAGGASASPGVRVHPDDLLLLATFVQARNYPLQSRRPILLRVWILHARQMLTRPTNRKTGRRCVPPGACFVLAGVPATLQPARVPARLRGISATSDLPRGMPLPLFSPLSSLDRKSVV